MSDHPPSFRLDAHVAGDLDPKVTEHVATCPGCAAYVASMTSGAAAFAADEGKRAADFVLGLRDEAHANDGIGHDATPTMRSARARLARIAWIATPLLVAAALFLVVRGRESRPLVPLANEPATRFKGKMQLAVVRDRNGDQSRLLGEVRVGPGDRLRVEVSLDDTRPIEVGFLGKDGTWVLLLAPSLVEAGTHFSERAARFDASPTEGWIVAGHPDAVGRARTTRSFDDVTIVTVIKEP